jgi:hypothetical protein
MGLPCEAPALTSMSCWYAANINVQGVKNRRVKSRHTNRRDWEAGSRHLPPRSAGGKQTRSRSSVEQTLVSASARQMPPYPFRFHNLVFSLVIV